MIKGITKTGFEFKIDEKRVKDWKFVKAIRNLHKGDEYVVDVADIMLGEEQAIRLERHLMDEEGFIDAEIMGSELAEIIEACEKSDTNAKN